MAAAQRLCHFCVAHRYVIGLLSMTLLVAIAVVSMIFSKVPSFNDPFTDFVTIGTDWSANIQQFHALIDGTNSVPGQQLYGIKWIDNKTAPFPSVLSRKRREQRSFIESNVLRDDDVLCLDAHGYSGLHPLNLWSVYAAHTRIIVSMDQNPNMKSVQNFKTPANVSNVFTKPGALRSLCQLQQRMEQLPSYQKYCLRRSSAVHLERTGNLQHIFPSDECCPIWSLATFTAVLQGLDSCRELTESVVLAVGDLLASCLPAFTQGQLTRSCWDVHGTEPSLLCPSVHPPACLTSPLVPLMLGSSLPEGHPVNWRTTMLQLPQQQLGRSLSTDLFTDVQRAYASGQLTGHLSVPLFLGGSYFPSAYTELVTRLASHEDAVWLLLGLATLGLLLALVTASPWVPVVSLLAISWSLLVAFAVYCLLVPSDNEFSLLNLMALVLAIGLGADDVLVYQRLWRQSKHYVNDSHGDSGAPFSAVAGGEQTTTDLITLSPLVAGGESVDANGVGLGRRSSQNTHIHMPIRRGCSRKSVDQLGKRLHFTLSHAVPSMVLTSISTIFGLLVNLLSSVVAVKRFAIFSTLVVVCNLFFVLSSAPIIFTLVEPLHGLRCVCLRQCSPSVGIKRYRINPFRYLGKFVLHFRYPLICLSMLLNAWAIYQLFYRDPFFQSPSDSSSSFLRQTHPFEMFMHRQSKWFWTERQLHHYQNLLQLHFVWGYLPWDDRSLLTFSRTDEWKLKKWRRDFNFNMTSKMARSWLSRFCDDRLRQAPFLLNYSQSPYRPQSIPSFYIPQLNPSVTQPIWCPFGRYQNSLDSYVFTYGCYNASSACCPAGKSIDLETASTVAFLSCLKEFTLSDNIPPLDSRQANFRFLARSDNTQVEDAPVGLVITMTSNISLANTDALAISRAIQQLTDWFAAALATAPTSLAGGRLVSASLAPLEVTLSVTQYLHWSLLLSVSLAAGLVLVASRSLWVGLMAGVHVTSCLLVTCALLTSLDGWRLGLVEALVISLAAGLAIDPCLHLALASATTGDPVEAVVCLLAPPIAGSTASTALAGLAMLAAQLWCYHQVGAFLATLMASAWLVCHVFFASSLACWADVSRRWRLLPLVGRCWCSSVPIGETGLGIPPSRPVNICAS